MIAEPTTKPTNLMPAWGYVHAVHDHSLRRLVAAIIMQAAQDARRDDLYGYQARAWLASEDGRFYAESIGVNYRALQDWVKAGCPDFRTSTREREQ